MTTATIDLDTLDKLFDNQKKLDDIFSSIFDDDAFFSNINDDALESSVDGLYSNEDMSFKDDETIYVHKERSMAYFIMPMVLEVAAIYYGIVYFF